MVVAVVVVVVLLFFFKYVFVFTDFLGKHSVGGELVCLQQVFVSKRRWDFTITVDKRGDFDAPFREQLRSEG